VKQCVGNMFANSRFPQIPHVLQKLAEKESTGTMSPRAWQAQAWRPAAMTSIDKSLNLPCSSGLFEPCRVQRLKSTPHWRAAVLRVMPGVRCSPPLVLETKS